MTIQQENGTYSTRVPPKKQLKRWRKTRSRLFDSALLPDPVPWDEQTTSFASFLFALVGCLNPCDNMTTISGSAL